MNPEQLAKAGNEHSHQAALFCWVAMAQNRGFEAANDMAAYANVGNAERYGTAQAVPELKWFHAIPNGGSRGDTAKSARIQGGMMKAEGVKPGVADTFLPVRRGVWPGLYIEMKKPAEKPKRADSKGGLSDKQEEFRDFVKAQGFGWVVCYSWREAADILQLYFTT